MKNIYKSIISVLRIIFTITFAFLMNTGNAFSSGTLYLDQDFDNPSFPPSGWEVSNTSN